MQPQQKLHESMLAITRKTLEEADAVIALIPYTKGAEPFDIDFAAELFNAWLKPAGKPVIAVLNKSDLASRAVQEKAESVMTRLFCPASVISVSALEGTGLKQLVDILVPFLPMNDPLYPEDILSTAPERFFVSEIIGKKIFLLYGKEVPYAAEVVVDEFREQHENNPSRKDLIRCSIVVERDTQKQILIGSGGNALKKLGKAARTDIEELLGRPVSRTLHKGQTRLEKETEPSEKLRLLKKKHYRSCRKQRSTRSRRTTKKPPLKQERLFCVCSTGTSRITSNRRLFCRRTVLRFEFSGSILDLFSFRSDGPGGRLRSPPCSCP